MDCPLLLLDWSVCPHDFFLPPPRILPARPLAARCAAWSLAARCPVSRCPIPAAPSLAARCPVPCCPLPGPSLPDPCCPVSRCPLLGPSLRKLITHFFQLDLFLLSRLPASPVTTRHSCPRSHAGLDAHSGCLTILPAVFLQALHNSLPCPASSGLCPVSLPGLWPLDLSICSCSVTCSSCPPRTLAA